MSRLCRLKNKTHGEDGLWAHGEITALRAKLIIAAEALQEIRNEDANRTINYYCDEALKKIGNKSSC